MEILEDSLEELSARTHVIQNFNFTSKKYRNLHVLSVKFS